MESFLNACRIGDADYVSKLAEREVNYTKNIFFIVSNKSKRPYYGRYQFRPYYLI